MHNKRIAIIGTVGIPAKYGGFETLVEYLTKNLHQKYKISVFCSTKHYLRKLDTYNGADLFYVNLNANGVQSIFYDIVSIFKSLSIADTLLILGVSGCISLPFIKVFSQKKIIVNIDGLEHQREKWGKSARWFLKFSEKLAVQYADIIVSDNKVIQNYIQSEYHQDSALIAYGADHVTKEVLSTTLIQQYPFLKNNYAFKVCRIEPENNIHIILEAFKLFSDLNLVIIGNWDNSEYGKTLKKTYSSTENIFLFDPIYDQKTLNQIRSNCYLYIHGHSAGGTNPSLVEAMYLHLPVFAYGVHYNKETTKNKALYFNNIHELVELLKNTDADTLKILSSNMEQIALEHYTWKKISTLYSQLF